VSERHTAAVKTPVEAHAILVADTDVSDNGGSSGASARPLPQHVDHSRPGDDALEFVLPVTNDKDCTQREARADGGVACKRRMGVGDICCLLIGRGTEPYSKREKLPPLSRL